MPRLFRSARPDAASGGASAPSNGALSGWAHERPTPPEVLRGRYEFTRQFSDLAKGKRNWQWVAALSLALLGLAVAGLVTLASQSRVVPYVVEVDRVGRAEAIAPADAATVAEDRVVVAALSSFVSNIRTVYADPVAQRDAVYRAYAHVAGDARDFLEGYFSDPQNDPRRLGKDFRRAVEVTAVLAGAGHRPGHRPDLPGPVERDRHLGRRRRAGARVGGLRLGHARPAHDDGGHRAEPARRVRDRPLVEPARRSDHPLRTRDDTEEPTAEPEPPSERPARRPRQTVRAPGDTTPPSTPDLR